uniref:Zinc finger CCCH domain-containing protein 22 isoform X3 n=1 Tax=Rhizophora mucronata TaxID=61149 RepID=A0A2P2M8K1_RHIMU
MLLRMMIDVVIKKLQWWLCWWWVLSYIIFDVSSCLVTLIIDLLSIGKAKFQQGMSGRLCQHTWEWLHAQTRT